MRNVDFFAAVICPLIIFLSSTLQAETPFFCAGHQLDYRFSGAAKAPMQGALPTRGRINVLVVFARFQDEDARPLPSFADQLLDPDLPGSFAHFYRTMSFDQLQVRGTVLPRPYVSDQPRATYLAEGADEVGQFTRFAREILRQVDADTDLGQFDNDGPDGVPNSGDDDGVVDYVFINLQSVPPHFLSGNATGKAGLGFEEAYLSSDLSARGTPCASVAPIPAAPSCARATSPSPRASWRTNSATPWACPISTTTPTTSRPKTAPASAAGG